jgi:hypothetical protein
VCGLSSYPPIVRSRGKKRFCSKYKMMGEREEGVLFIVNSTHHVNNTLHIRSTRPTRPFEDAEAHLSVIACTFRGRIWTWRSRRHGTATGRNDSAVRSTTRMCIYNPISVNFSSSSKVLIDVFRTSYVRLTGSISIGLINNNDISSDSFDIRSFFQLHDLNRFVLSLKITVTLRKPLYFT